MALRQQDDTNLNVCVRRFFSLPQDVTHISRILDVCQELKALTLVLEATPLYFAVELAALAARREYLNLDKWLADRVMLQVGLPRQYNTSIACLFPRFLRGRHIVCRPGLSCEAITCVLT